MSQKSVSNAISDITKILERVLCPLHIKFPTTIEEKTKIKAKFYEKTGFFGVIGCVDGTHVRILAPSQNEHVYVDRHGVHSMNVQLVSINVLSLYGIVTY